jgi:hypothetical protein
LAILIQCTTARDADGEAGRSQLCSQFMQFHPHVGGTMAKKAARKSAKKSSAKKTAKRGAKKSAKKTAKRGAKKSAKKSSRR